MIFRNGNVGIRAWVIFNLVGALVFTPRGAYCQTSTQTPTTPSQATNAPPAPIPWVVLNGQTYECLPLPMPDLPELSTPSDFAIFDEDDVNNPPKLTDEKFDDGMVWGEKLVFHPRGEPANASETIMFFTTLHYCKAFVGFGINSGKIPEFLEQQ